MSRQIPYRLRNKIRILWWVGPVVLLLLLPQQSAAGAPPEVAGSGIETDIRQMQSTYAAISGYTCTFYKRERVNGKLLPRERIFMKFRKPFSVYMRWIGEEHEGQEVIYVRGKHDGKMIAHRGSFPDITLRVNPSGVLAMRNNRHPVTEAGIGATIQDIVSDYRRAEAHPEDSVSYTYLGEREIYGQNCRCYEVRVPDDRSAPYYALRSEICINEENALPVRIRVWNTRGALVEDYGFGDLDLQPGLTDRDFQPDNPAYEF